MLLLIFTLTTVSTVGSAQAGNGGTQQPSCPLGTTLIEGATIDGVPLCAVEGCPVGTSFDGSLCQPGDISPSCPPDTNLDFDICEAPSTCPSGTTLNPTSLLCERPDQPAVGGQIIQIDSAALLLSGVQTNATWLLPVVLSVVGIGLVLVRKK